MIAQYQGFWWRPAFSTSVSKRPLLVIASPKKLEHDRFKCDHALAFLTRAIHVLAPRKVREPKTIAL